MVPAAIVCEVAQVDGQHIANVDCTKQLSPGDKLYTHPLRELSVEECLSLWETLWITGGFAEVLHSFARAVIAASREGKS
jgi:hypothetical protein